MRIPWDPIRIIKNMGLTANSNWPSIMIAVKSWNGLGYWDVYRDGVWEDSIYLNEGNLPLSHTTHTVKTPVGTVKSRAARLMMRFPQNRDRPRKPPLLTWMGIPQLTLKWNSRDENTARKRGCSKAIESLVMQVTEPKTHPVEQSWKLLKTESKLDISWYALANSGGLWGGCCFAGDTEFELHAGDRTLADESMSVYDYEEEDASGHETMTVTLEKVKLSTTYVQPRRWIRRN